MHRRDETSCIETRPQTVPHRCILPLFGDFVKAVHWPASSPSATEALDVAVQGVV